MKRKYFFTSLSYYSFSHFYNRYYNLYIGPPNPLKNVSNGFLFVTGQIVVVFTLAIDANVTASPGMCVMTDCFILKKSHLFISSVGLKIVLLTLFAFMFIYLRQAKFNDSQPYPPICLPILYEGVCESYASVQKGLCLTLATFFSKNVITLIRAPQALVSIKQNIKLTLKNK